MDRIDRSQRGVEKFLSLKALRGLKEGRGRRAGRLGARERRFQRGAAEPRDSQHLVATAQQQALSQLAWPSLMRI